MIVHDEPQARWRNTRFLASKQQVRKIGQHNTRAQAPIRADHWLLRTGTDVPVAFSSGLGTIASRPASPLPYG